MTLLIPGYTHHQYNTFSCANLDRAAEDEEEDWHDSHIWIPWVALLYFLAFQKENNICSWNLFSAYSFIKLTTRTDQGVLVCT